VNVDLWLGPGRVHLARRPGRPRAAGAGGRQRHRERRHPGLTASTVDFEDSLRAALADGVVDPQEAAPVVNASTSSPGLNGNNVDLGAETMTQMQATFRYQLLSRAVGDRYALVRDAIGGM
jgi:flagellar basal body rod protein FlgB